MESLPTVSHSPTCLLNRRYGEWLRAEAERLGVPILPARPWDTVFGRALDMLRQPVCGRRRRPWPHVGGPLASPDHRRYD